MGPGRRGHAGGYIISVGCVIIIIIDESVTVIFTRAGDVRARGMTDGHATSSSSSSSSAAAAAAPSSPSSTSSSSSPPPSPAPLSALELAPVHARVRALMAERDWGTFTKARLRASLAAQLGEGGEAMVERCRCQISQMADMIITAEARANFWGAAAARRPRGVRASGSSASSSSSSSSRKRKRRRRRKLQRAAAAAAATTEPTVAATTESAVAAAGAGDGCGATAAQPAAAACGDHG
jgi:hypothetical protein